MCGMHARLESPFASRENFAMSHQTPESFHFQRRQPPGDDRTRLVCGQCDWIHYENPKIVVGSVVTWQDQLLLCKRAIEPRRGYWTIPAGYMELHETAEEGAMREAWEEALARIEIDALLGIYSIPSISQVQMIYRATLKNEDFAAGPESEAVQLVSWSEIPWQELAFPSVHWALQHFQQVQGKSEFPPFTTPRNWLVADQVRASRDDVNS